MLNISHQYTTGSGHGLYAPQQSQATTDQFERRERRREIGQHVARITLDLLLVGAVGYVLWWSISMTMQ